MQYSGPTKCKSLPAKQRDRYDLIVVGMDVAGSRPSIPARNNAAWVRLQLLEVRNARAFTAHDF